MSKKNGLNINQRRIGRDDEKKIVKALAIVAVVAAACLLFLSPVMNGNIEAAPATFELDGMQYTVTSDPSSEKLGEVTLAKSLSVIKGDLILPDTAKGYVVTSIGKVFANNTDLGAVTLPAKLVSIGNNAFEGCVNMTLSSGLPDSITSIGSATFNGCKSLGKINYPDSLTKIDNYAFMNCDNLDFTNSVRSGSGFVSIGSYSFKGCSSLTNIPLPENISVNRDSFFGCSKMDVTGGGTLTLTDIYSENSFFGCTALGGTNSLKIVISDKLTTIQSGLFRHCASITSIHLSENLTAIGNSILEGCTNAVVDNVGIIPSKVTQIGSSAFSGCKSITGHLVIPENVTAIANNAFFLCENLELISFMCPTEPTISNSAFTLSNETTKTIKAYTAFKPVNLISASSLGKLTKIDCLKSPMVTIECSDIQGTINPKVGTHAAAYGMNFYLTVINSPVFVSKVTSGGKPLDVDNGRFVVPNVTEDVTVIVEFLKIFSVNVDPGKGGSVLFKIGEDGKYNT